MVDGMSAETRAQLLDVLAEASIVLKLMEPLAVGAGRHEQWRVLLEEMALSRGRLIEGTADAETQSFIRASTTDCGEFIADVLTS